MEIIVKKGQSLYDIAMIYCGNAIAAFSIAIENELEVDAELSAGQKLEYSGSIINTNVVNYMKLNEVNAASAISNGDDHAMIFDYVFEQIFE